MIMALWTDNTLAIGTLEYNLPFNVGYHDLLLLIDLFQIFQMIPVLSAIRNWIGLDLFNDDTRPSGHISRPAQVNVSQSGFHSLNNYSSLIILYTSGG